MTSPLSRSRSRRATSHIAVRVAHAVLGGLLAVGWLLLPVTRAGADEVRDAPGRGGTSTGDLVLPLVAVLAAGALAAYSYARRTRRARTRTTPGGGTPHPVPFAELDRRAGRLLVEIDDCVRSSTEELGWAADRFGEEAVATCTKALVFARSELTASFRLWQRLDDTLTDDSLVRRQLLEEIVARCTEAGRRLDAEAPGFDLLRALERTLPAALESAEARFRELTARTPAAEATFTELRERYAPSASLSVAGNVEQAKDRLVFATTRLDRARQSLDRGRAPGRRRICGPPRPPSTRRTSSWPVSTGWPPNSPPRRPCCPVRCVTRTPSSWPRAASRPSVRCPVGSHTPRRPSPTCGGTSRAASVRTTPSAPSVASPTPGHRSWPRTACPSTGPSSTGPSSTPRS
ncbi:hypothetical protein [Streptomyces mirabilis]|uniref:hypothetical protein n=1 Tax=Streptomyces mirabilis TaxID=68239 RepID=UPI0031BB679B